MGRKKKELKPEVSLAEILKVKDEIIQDLEARLDSAYMEQEQMLSELERNLNIMLYHCQQVENNTGAVSMEDINYYANLIDRVMKHKFEYKPKSFE